MSEQDNNNISKESDSEEQLLSGQSVQDTDNTQDAIPQKPLRKKSKDTRSAREKLALALNLFLSYFKIGLFTFGGGYAMIALIDREFVQKKKWINEVELYEIIAVAESTPGPIAINCATFVGYKILGFWGSFLSTVAVCIPSFVIIYLIAIFYDAFMSLKVVANAFEGIKVGIALMITSAGISMIKKAKKNAFSIGVFILSFALASLIDIFNLDFSTIYLILLGGVAGIVAQFIKDAADKKKKRKVGVEDSKDVEKDGDDISESIAEIQNTPTTEKVSEDDINGTSKEEDKL